MNEIIRQRVRGRYLDNWTHGMRRRGEWAQMKAGKPPGYTHTSLAHIPREHYSSRMLQDNIESHMRRAIARERPGRRRDFLIRDLELWIANGRPTAASQNPVGQMPREMEPIRTWHRGKPIHSDYSEMRADEREKRVRKLLRIG